MRGRRLGAAMAANDLRQDYVRAVVDATTARLVATPFAIQDSSMLRVAGRRRRADRPSALRAGRRSRRRRLLRAADARTLNKTSTAFIKI